MGDPRKQRKKYKAPSHPWEAERIQQEKLLKEEYGLKNKKEIWKFNSKVKKINIQARRILASRTEQSKKEEKQLIDKLYRQGIIEEENIKIDDILDLNIKKILDRRLQTLVFKKGLSKSIKQARQFITHRAIIVKDRLITSPSYIVLRDEEKNITFNPSSHLSNPKHPERNKEKDIKKISEEETKKIEDAGKEIITDEERFKETQQKAQEMLKDLQDKKIEENLQNAIY